MIKEIQTAIRLRGITRLCHFTPSRNLGHIASGQLGILATSRLEEDERKDFNPTDLLRLDGYKTHISCSVEYPNAWYFAKAAERERLFIDWVVLALDSDPLSADETLFCPYNASRTAGAGIRGGIEGFNQLFADSVLGYTRSQATPSWQPTDEQAEVLVKDMIPITSIHGVIVESVEQAKREAVRLEMLRLDPAAYSWRIAPVLFRKYDLSSHLKRGARPVEELWEPW